VSYQRPIFNGQQGLFGKANREVMNGLVDGTAFVDQFADAILWADSEMRNGQLAIRWFLAALTSATVIDSPAAKRWWYSGSAKVITRGSDYSMLALANTGDSSDTFTHAVNLREMFNDSGTADGMATNSPPVSVGPVGSSYAGSNAWTTSGLHAVVCMGVTYDKYGKPLYFFDRPNPVRCWDDSLT
jgi:hypothetical protein